MGFALPAAIGAQMALPGEQVWVTAGDGGFQMNIQELATVVQERLPLKIAILNNGYLGMVRQWQQLFFEGRYSGTPLLGSRHGGDAHRWAGAHRLLCGAGRKRLSDGRARQARERDDPPASAAWPGYHSGGKIRRTTWKNIP